jgi:hypothetical protein
MSRIAPLTFHIDETWQIAFSAFDSTGIPMPLPLGSVSAFRIATLDTPPVILIDCSSETGDGSVVITDPVHGLGAITIPPALQTAANIAAGVYRYEWRVETTALVSIQAEGRLTVMPSLFVGVP